MVYKELVLDNLIEIDSVSSFISEIKTLQESTDGTSTELYFRGQEAEFWDIEPSIFRNDMLSIEHKLMQIPLQKTPMEFKEFNTMFDIMTKYQHYGMCTRLLDLTTNPLVALYFACKTHGDEKYETEDGQVEKEPYGVVYYTNNYYLSQSTDQEIKIVSALASYDLNKENTIKSVLTLLQQDKIINKDLQERWLNSEYVQEFIDIIQRNYMVIPTYTNERLRRQNGIFLLASAFSVNVENEIKSGIITKTKDNLRREFSENYFYIDGENKDAILKELDLYNINEATLFPELEHQLSYIRNANSAYARTVSEFTKFEKAETVKDEILVLNSKELQEFVISNLDKDLNKFINVEDLEDIKSIIKDNLTVDWYKKSSTSSKIKMDIARYYANKSDNNINSKDTAAKLLLLLNEYVKIFISKNIQMREKDEY